MSIVSHLVATDVRRHRLLLGAWLLCIAATTIAGGVQPLLSAEALARGTGLIGGLLSLTQTLLMLVLIASVVHTHPLVGSNAFWMTRPISPDALLMSKMLLLGFLTVAAPAIAAAALMAAYDVPARQMAPVLVQFTLYQSFWMVVLMTAAALTPNLTRFVLLCGGAVAVLAILVASSLAFAMSAMEDRPPLSGGGETGDSTSGFVLFALIIVAGLSVLVRQYRNRSRIRSLAVAAAGLLVAFGGAYVWPWPLLSPAAGTPAWASAGSALVLTANSDTVDVTEERSAFGGRSAWALARARLTLSGIEPAWSAEVGVLHGRLQVHRGPALESVVAGHAAVAPLEGSQERPTRRVLRELLDVDTLVDGGPPRGESTIVFFVRNADFRKVAPATGTYQGRFRVRLISHAIEAALPLEPGATHQNGAYRFVVAGMERGSASVSIRGRESDATSQLDRQPVRELSFYLRNRRTREAVAGSPSEFEQPSLLMLLGFGVTSEASGFRARSRVVRFPPGYGDNRESIAIDDQWLADADLVLVRATRQGAVERQLEIADFPLRLSSKSTAASQR